MSESFVESLMVEPEYDDCRLDVFLAAAFPDRSRAYFQKLIRDGRVSVGEKTVTKAGFSLSFEDEVTVSFPEPKALSVEPENIPLDIVYEDDQVILVNKPKGMVVHPAAGHFSGTLVNALLYHCTDLSGINGVLRPGIVHRIDRDTTGIVIACKTDLAHRAIAEQLKVHSITRRYRAIVKGDLPEDEGTITGDIGRDPKDRKRMAVVPEGKDAVTHYTVLERFGNYTFVECRLETGRTHQIRVHMAHIGHPLLGDDVYGSGKSPFKTGGQVLHAAVLGFIHPVTGEYMEFSAELPDYFGAILSKLRNA